MKRVLLLVPILVLAACGVTRPGAAAVVDGHTISQQEADDAAQVFCRISLLTAQQQGVRELSNAEVRRESIRQLVLGWAADRVAKDEGLDLPQGRTTLTPSDRDRAAQLVPDLDRDTVVDVLEDSQRFSAIVTALGEQRLGQKAGKSNAQQIQNAGLSRVQHELRSVTVRYAPRYGLDSESAQTAQTGSLSTTVRKASDETASLPKTQRCA